jgi:nucleoside-diphosphate-sugar epimerase
MILFVGGAGFIGARATLALVEAGHDVTVRDSFVNGHPAASARIGRIAGRSPRPAPATETQGQPGIRAHLSAAGCRGGRERSLPAR